MQEEERARQVWGRYGEAYDDAFTRTNMAIAEMALSLAGLAPGMTLLDVAAGSGALSIPAARLGADVLATDLSPAMLDLLLRRAAKEDLTGIETRVMDGRSLDVGEHRFDRVCSEFGVMFFAEEGLPEMRRVTTPGGKGVVIIFGPMERNPLSLYKIALKRALPDAAEPTGFSPIGLGIDLAHAMEAAGYRDVTIHPHAVPVALSSGLELWRWMSGASPGYATLVAGLTEDQRSVLRETLIAATAERYGEHFSEVSMDVVIGIGNA